MRNRYLTYLYDLVGGAGNYTTLLQQLHEVEFYSLVPNDDNRGVDGEQLRIKFIDEMGPQGSSYLPDHPCSVLEMMIGLAYRLEFELIGGLYERPMTDWFWILVDNLRLTDFNDILYREGHEIRSKVGRIIRVLLDREYDTDGFGGLFPLGKSVTKTGKTVTKDQRRIEIWYQMNAWVMQNYPI